MPISLVNVDDLQEHLLGVLRRSDHHAGDVNEVLLTIAGAILWRKSPGDAVKVNTKEGAGGNVIWFRVDGTRYALLYNHVDRRIELAEGGRKGELIKAFTIETTTQEVVRVFAALGDGVLELSKSRKLRKEDRPEKEGKSPAERQRLKAERQQAKQARVGERDEKVRGKREERRATRAAGKAERAAAAEPIVVDAGRPAAAPKRSPRAPAASGAAAPN
ncbi:MAG: hypothetical protein U1F53_19725 [Burkholderiaceae bacterium]